MQAAEEPTTAYNFQLFVVLYKKEKDPNEDNFVRLAIAKKNLPNTNITLVVAIGYEGGGCYADYCGAYLIDEFGEEVEETIEECNFSDESEEYTEQYDELAKFMYQSIYYDEDMDAPRLNEDLKDQIENYDDRTFELNWDWSNEAHIEASQNWSIFYRWEK